MYYKLRSSLVHFLPQNLYLTYFSAGERALAPEFPDFDLKDMLVAVENDVTLNGCFEKMKALLFAWANKTSSGNLT